MGMFGIALMGDLESLGRRFTNLVKETREGIARDNRSAIEQEVRRQLNGLRSQLALSPIGLSGGVTVTLEDVVEAVLTRIDVLLEARFEEKLKQAMDSVDWKDIADRVYQDTDLDTIEEKLVATLAPLFREALGKEDLTQAIADKFLEDEYLDIDDTKEAIGEAVANRVRFTPSRNSE